MAPAQSPVLIALVDDYDVVLTGIASMLDPYRDRVLVADHNAEAGNALVAEDPTSTAFLHCDLAGSQRNRLGRSGRRN